MLWYENYHISLVSIATREIYIFITLGENKSRNYRNNMNIYPLYANLMKTYQFSRTSKAVANVECGNIRV